MERKTRLRIALSLGSLALTFAALEITGRVVVPAPVERKDGFRNDDQLGWILPKGEQMVWRGKQAQVNSLGFRGSEPVPGKPTVLIVGDSSVFGDGVDDDQTMSAQLARALDGRADVQNAGVPGYTCWQSRIWVDRVRPQLSPDVLVVYNQHSDYRRASSHDRVIAATQLGWLANTGIGGLISYLSLRQRMSANASNLSMDEYGTCLRDIAQDQRSAGGSVVFVQPISEVDFPNSPLFGQPEPGEPGTRLVDYQDTMRSVAKAIDAPFIVGSAAVQAAGLSGDAALIDTVHPTAAGHAALAQGIASAILSSGLLGTSSSKR